MAGLPGTGLGGIFYVLLIVWMALRESWLLARGSSTRGRWTKIAWLGSLAASIVAALWIEGLALRELIGSAPAMQRVNAAPAAFALDALTPALALAPFAILALLLVSLHLTRLLLRPPRQARHAGR